MRKILFSILLLPLLIGNSLAQDDNEKFCREANSRAVLLNQANPCNIQCGIKDSTVSFYLRPCEGSICELKGKPGVCVNSYCRAL